jgi:20S proteasome subunit alpha 6
VPFLGRGGAFNTTFHNTPDAPRGPAKTRNVKIDKDASSSGHPFSSVNTIGSKSGKKAKEPEEKRTVTDFKIVGLELPELSWKWGSVPEKEREEEGKKRKADGSEAGGALSFFLFFATDDLLISFVNDLCFFFTDSANDPEAVPHPAKHRTSYFLTHGKGTTDAPELANKDMNRLRIYFDSPAGSGSGEKRGRGGIEGLRAKPGKTAGVQAARAPSEAPSAAAEKEGGDGQAVEGETPTEEDGEELDGEPMEDPSDPSKQPDGEPNTGEEEDAVEALATDIEEADTTKPTPLDAPSTSAYTPSQAYIDNEHPIEIPSSTPPPSETLAFDASAAAASLDLPEPEETGDVSMASARSSAEPEVASSALENGTTLSGTVASDKAPIEQVTSSVIPTDTSATEASSEHPEPPSSPRKPHPYTDAPILANNLRSPSPTTSHLATEHHPAPEPTPASSQTPHVPPTAQELREEKTMPIYTGPEPSPNRVSILYQQCTRRLCIDAEVVERVRVSRAEGKVEFTIRWRKGEKTSVAVLAAASSDAASGSTSAPVPAQTRADEGVKQEDEAEGEVKTEGGASPMKISSPVKQATADPIKQEESNLEMPDIPIVEKVTDASSKPAVEETTPAAVEESKEKEDSRTWDICRGILVSSSSSSPPFAAVLSLLSSR